MKLPGWFTVLAMTMAAPATAQTIEQVSTQAVDRFSLPLPMHVHGRTSPELSNPVAAALLRQWPGTYFETAFDGDTVAFRVGPGEVHLRVSLDGALLGSLMKPKPGLYEIAGLKPKLHALRVDVASENQDYTTSFGGFYSGADTRPAPVVSRTRQIEFIGDSYTVGYGNTSTTHTCSSDKIFRTTDTSQGIGPRVAKGYDADYQVNAISGRGVVRNYNGAAGDPVPVAYPYQLFDKQQRDQGVDWNPQVIIISLGTNDFSTALKPSERWSSQQALRDDFETTYVDFVRKLRARDSHAYILLWAPEFSGSEVVPEERKIVDKLHASGDQRVGFVPVPGLQMTACNSHPGLADDKIIAATIRQSIDAIPDIWHGKSGAPTTGTPTKNTGATSTATASRTSATQLN